MKNDMANSSKEGAGKKRLVPELRFPEFEREGEWEEKTLGGVCKIGNGKDYKHLNKGNVPVYGSGGYMTSVDDFLYDGDSVCIGRKGTIDKPIFLTGKFWTVDTLFYTHSFCSCIPKFLYFVFLQIDWFKYNEAGGVPSLSKRTIENINILIPTNKKGQQNEQQKIVNCLSSIDEEISAIKKKVEQLKAHKKGLMQKLFPVQGKLLPEVRFTEFEKEREWEEEPLGCCYKLRGGYAFKSAKFQNKGIPIVRISNIPTDSLYIDLSDCVYYEDILDNKDFFIKNGDLLLAMSGATTGKTAIYNQKEPAYLNQRVGVFRSIKSTNCYSFLCQWVKTCNYNEQLGRLLTAGAQPNISSADVETLILQYPKNPDEQQKIAECLSSLDELINLYENKGTLLEQHKKGLMQQLFPKL